MLGIWKNFDELEESLSLQELNFILDQKREQDRIEKVFLAAIQGIDLEKNAKNPVQQRVEEVKRRAAAQQLGEEEVKRQEFSVMGFGYVTEE